MSGQAVGWAKRQHAPDRETKSLLVFLADYVQDTPFAWPAVATLAGELQVSERTVQRMLPQLLEAGVLVGYEVKDKATGRCRTRAYYFPIDGELPTLAQVRSFELNAGCILTRLSASGAPLGEGDNTVTGEGATGVTGEGDNTVTGRVTAVSPLNEPLLEQSDADASSTGGRASDGDGFEQAWAAYPEAGRLGVSSERQAREAWAGELVGGAAPERMVAGVQAYAADPRVWGASGRPKAFHRFLTLGCWVEFAERSAPDAAAAIGGRWPGPDHIRASIAKGLGEDTASSCLDHASWNGEAIVARTRWAADQLRSKGRAVLAELGVEVLNPP